MTFIVPRPTDAPALLSVSALLFGAVLAGESTACVCVGCGNSSPANAAPAPGDEKQPPPIVLLAVQDGVGIRLACIASDKDYETQRPICERAIASLRRLRKTP